MAIPDTVARLVEQFERNRDSYRSQQYNEANLRKEYIEPFFSALGWDMENKAGNAERYKDVTHEDAIKVGGATKAPDYSFRIGETRKFFVEAKKPAVSITGDTIPAYQLRRYAWSAKLPLSILTNFADFAVYDCRVKPDQDDKASTARTMLINYTQYAQRWEEIASVFSKDAILKGSFDKYAATSKGKRGTAEVDDAFLKEIESWRDTLARNLALRNPALTQRELNTAVQLTIDRLIFLRICEDRRIEDYGRLLALRNGERVYPRLIEIFRAADDRYNSGLFHFRKEGGRPQEPDGLTLNLTVDDKPLKDIIKNLYYPDSPYEFSVLPADILGQVYEQFLGKVIRLTVGHHAVVEDKPEVKKAGGVYYTPTYIVDYIVENTVAKLLEGKTPKQVGKLRILDPACGSGSFLIGAYQYLLDWHLKWYMDDGAQKWASRKEPRLHEPTTGTWLLTAAERKRILLNNIYGVDIDPQAVEVTKLSLLLKVLEGRAQFTVIGERMLPDLGGNIKCGNSLIGPDFHADPETSRLDDNERLRINVFDWQAKFPEIMKAGGFDAVIGNPPYVFGEYHDENAKHYFRANYAVAREQYDTYWLFVEQGIRLTSSGGYFSLIVPDALLARDQARNVREILLDSGIESVYHCGLVFRAKVSAVVYVVRNGCAASVVTSWVREGEQAVQEHICSTERFRRNPQRRLLVHASDAQAALIARLAKDTVPLLDASVRNLSRGEEMGKSSVLSSGEFPIVVGDDISRYHIQEPSRFIAAFSKPLEQYTAPKIVIVKTGGRCIAAIDTDGLLTMQSVYNLHVRDNCPAATTILGILNSRLVSFFINKTFTAYKLLFPQLNQNTIECLPIPTDLVEKQKPLTLLVDHIISLHKQLSEANVDHDKTAIRSQIDATDRQIDLLVYELYGLTDEEIAIVEEATSG